MCSGCTMSSSLSSLSRCAKSTRLRSTPASAPSSPGARATPVIARSGAGSPSATSAAAPRCSRSCASTCPCCGAARRRSRPLPQTRSWRDGASSRCSTSLAARATSPCFCRKCCPRRACRASCSSTRPSRRCTQRRALNTSPSSTSQAATRRQARRTTPTPRMARKARGEEAVAAAEGACNPCAALTRFGWTSPRRISRSEGSCGTSASACAGPHPHSSSACTCAARSRCGRLICSTTARTPPSPSRSSPAASRPHRPTTRAAARSPSVSTRLPLAKLRHAASGSPAM
mmetsp:Transcript_8377/g.33991  ORF Transcript_8377/g.33991 Transcript_8377/m.33991 type:complete len:288 (-) Transcript_8377:367-1230(-)